MGVWSCGNFDNDGALDYVGGLVDSFVTRIESILADDVLAGPDEDGERILMPTVEIIATLCEKCRCAPPRPAVVESWRDRYLRVFDAEIEELQPTEGYVVERRRVILHTFDGLLAQTRRFWREE